MSVVIEVEVKMCWEMLGVVVAFTEMIFMRSDL